MTLIRLPKHKEETVFKISQASNFSKFKKTRQLNYHQPPSARGWGDWEEQKQLRLHVTWFETSAQFLTPGTRW